MKLARRVSKIKPSPTLAITARAQALKASGRPIIGFGAGEPDFDTPENIKQEAIKAINSGFTKYTPVGGTDELKDAIIAKLRNEYGLSYERKQVLVSCGAKHSLFNLAQVLFDKGDRVIVPAPYWVSYPDIVLLSGATPVILKTTESEGFKISPARLRSAITKKTRALILNSPSNPTGAAYSESELAEIAEIVRAAGILVISDDIYEKILYDGLRFRNIVSLCPDLMDRAVIVNGVSKSYAMTGWRIGYAAGPEEVIRPATELQSQNTSNPASISQKAALEALTGPQDVVNTMVAEFQRRRDVIVGGLNAIRGISCLKPAGAFYVFPNISRLFKKSFQGNRIGDSYGLSEYLLDEANVAVVPGAAFGNDRHIRLSYATSMSNIKEGLRRIKSAVEALT